MVSSPAGLALVAAHVGAAPRRPTTSPSSPTRVHLLPARTASVVKQHTRLRVKQHATADDGAKECHPCAPADKDGRTETDPYAGQWPWGNYFPDEAELCREDFFYAQERFSRESREAAAALKDMVAGVFRQFRPLLDNFRHLRSLRTIYDTEDYHVGMPFGALIACIGCYQLWKMDPSTFLEAALGYAFYKLSIVSSQLRKQGFSNALITRVKFFIIMLIMAINGFKNTSCPLDAIRGAIYILYALTFASEVAGVKKQIKYSMATLICTLKHPQGRRELRKMLSEAVLQLVSWSLIRFG
ncbi:unnamed protein product [Alopecurus aequalis]